jgi:hypothetical protein
VDILESLPIPHLSAPATVIYDWNKL